MKSNVKKILLLTSLGIIFALLLTNSSNNISNEQEDIEDTIDIQDETNLKTASSEITIITPENKTYTDPMSGYYPGTYSFDNDEIGSRPAHWTTHPIYSAGTVVESEGTHKTVMEIENLDINIYNADNTFNPQENGTIEFWLRTTHTGGDPQKIRLLEGTNIGPVSRIYNNKWQYYIGDVWYDMYQENGVDLMPAPTSNTWMHVKIEFECGSSGYKGLSPDTYRYIIDNVPSQAFDFRFGSRDYIDVLSFWTGATLTINYQMYIDAVGYSWDENYNINDNLKEGLLLSYENSTTLDWIGYSLDLQTNKTILGNTTIPFPDRGTHTIQIFGSDSFGNMYHSDLRQFTIGGISVLYNDENIIIIRDDYGVPHIYAKTKEGLAFGCGYATAQDRLWQADMYRRAAFGSLAEFGLASIDSDYQTRSLAYSREELREMFDNWVPTNPDARVKEMMLAYVDGMNLYIEEALEAYYQDDPSLIPVEYLPGALTPDGLVDHLENWTIEDSVAIMVMMTWRFGGTGGDELSSITSIMAIQEMYGDELGWDIFNDHFPQNNPGAEVTIPSTGCSDTKSGCPSFDPYLPDNIGEVYQEYEEAKMGQTQLFESLGLPTKFGSNAWLVSPEKSTTGNALMVGGPQMGQSIPQIVMEVGMHGAGINADGMMMPFAPFILIGVSEHGAWTLTTGASDVMDTYIEVLNPANQYQYWYKGGFVDMEKRTERFYGYKKLYYTEIDVYRTVHGPIISWDLENHLAFTIKTPYYKNEPAAEEGWALFQQARNIGEFEEACKTIQPSHNIFWIDRRGNIGYWHAGTFPIKPATGKDGRRIDDRFPLWGTGQEEWIGLTGFEEMPRCINPEQGWLANWNNKPVANWSYGESDARWGEGHRVKRIMDLLTAQDKLSFEDMNSINMDAAYNHINGMNHLDELIAAASTSSDPAIKAALPYLEAWNYSYNDFVDPRWPSPDATYDDPGLTIFEDWFERILEEVFGDDIPYTQIGSAHLEFARVWPNLLIHVFDGPDSTLQLNYDYLNGEDKTKVINRVLKWTIGNLTQELGPNMSTWLTPVRQWWPSQMGALPRPVMHYMNRGTFNQIVEMPTLGLPHAENVLPPGQSGFMNYMGQYSHAYDQLALYENWMYKPVILDQDVAPFIIINSPQNNQIFGYTAPNYNISIFAPNNDTMWYTINDGSGFIITDLTGTMDQAAWDTLNSSTVLLKFYINDTEGKIGVDQVLIRKDISPPETSISLSGDQVNDWYSSNVQVTLTATDEHSQVADTAYSLDGMTWIPYTGPFILTTEGVNTVYYNSTDLAGIIESTKSQIVKIDKTSPETSISLSGDQVNDWYSSNVQVTLTATDEHSQVATTAYSLDDITWIPYIGPFTLTTEGVNTVYYNSTDLAGNIEITKYQIIKIDKTPPETSISLFSQRMNRGWHFPNVQVTLNATDQHSQVAATAYSLDGLTWIPYTESFTLTTEGVNTIYYNSTDLAGNVETTKSEIICIDSSFPENQILLNGILGQNDWYISNVNVTVIGTDAVSGIYDCYLRIIKEDGTKLYERFFRMGGVERLEISVIIASEGKISVLFRVSDAVELWFVNGKDFKIDKTPPNTSISLSGTLGTNGLYTSDVTTTLNATDEHSQVSVTAYSLDGITWIPYTDPFNLTTEGVNTVYYNSTDLAGNIEITKSNDIIIDKTPPVTIIDDTDPTKSWTYTASHYDWCSGLGTPNDPYIIENVTFDSGGLGTCIEIRNSNVYFIIRNCTIINSSKGGFPDYFAGVKLINVKNGIIEGNSIRNNEIGICLINSDFNVISENIVENNQAFGIMLKYSDNNKILRNQANNNQGSGINLGSYGTCDNNIIIGNTANNNRGYRGLKLFGYNNTVSNNIFNRNYVGISSEGRNNDFLENIVNENSQYGMQISRSRYLRIFNNTINDNYGSYSIYFYKCHYNSIEGNTLINNKGGILFLEANNNTITSNLIHKNSGFGIRIKEHCNGNLITHNLIEENSDTGLIFLNLAEDNIVYSNNFTLNGINAIDNGHNNQWDNGTIGNYWDDYEGIDANDDGIGDTPYNITGSGGSYDKYPIWDDGPGPDIIAPATMIYLMGTPGINEWYLSDVIITLNGTDDASGINKTEYSFDNIIWINYTGSFSITDEGITTLYYRSIDNAGNVEVTKIKEIKIDKSVPETFIDLWGILGANGWYISNISVTLNATDKVSGIGLIEYRIDGGSWTIYTGSFPLWGQGITTVYYRSIDNAGNVEDPKEQVIKIDWAPPETMIFLMGTPGINEWYVSDVNVILNGTDNLSGVKSTEYSFDTINWINYIGWFSITDEGITTLYYRSVDYAGNLEETKVKEIKIDMTSPETSIDLWGILGANDWYISNVSVTLNATDEVSGVGMTEYRINGGSWTTYTESFPVWGQEITTIQYRSIDNAGNAEDPKEQVIQIDWAPPETLIFLMGTPGINEWYVSDVNVILNGTDNLSGVKSTEYSFDTINWINYVGMFSITDEGITTLYYRSIDYAGNLEVTMVKEIKVDMTPPQTSIDLWGILGANDWYISNVSVTLNATDEISGVGMTEYRIDGGSWTPYTGTFPIWGQGITTVYYRSIDNAGNAEDPKEQVIQIDWTRPETLISLMGTPGVNEWYLCDVEIILNATDNLSGVKYTEYSFDTINWINYVGPFSITDEGVTTLYYQSIDYVGNLEEMKIMEIKIDMTPPETSLDLWGILGANDWYISNVSVTLNATDEISGVALIEYCIDGGSWTPYTGTFPIWGQAIKTIQYRSIDNAGNVEETKEQEIKIDWTRPETLIFLMGTPGINEWYLCDVEIILNATDNLSGVKYTEYSFDTINWINYIDMFSIIDEGITTLYYRSIDYAGNLEETKVKEIKIDKSEPETSISIWGIIGANGWYISNVNVTLTATDEVSGVGMIEYRIDDGSWTVYMSPFLITDDGIITVYYRSIDVAGNIESIKTKTIKIVFKPFIIDNLGYGDYTWEEAADEVWCFGSGTLSDPYIIENIIVDGQGAASCIYINNSNVIFIIKNCTFINSGSWGLDAGIRLENSYNGKLYNNTCSNNNNHGIVLSYSNNNSIWDNIITNNSKKGIFLNYSNYNLISANTITENNGTGIYDYNSHDNTISGNIITNNGDDCGIYLDESNNNIISGNIITENEGDGIALEECNDNIILENIVNGNDESGISLEDSDNNILSENTAENNINGISLEDSNSNSISDNTVNNNENGIALDSSNGNIISENTLDENEEDIIEENCEDNTIEDNVFIISPIVIDEKGEGDYTWAEVISEDWCSGSGTLEDPYIINGLLIDGGNIETCITIRNSKVYFRIENCTFKNSGSYNAGIKLFNTKNGQLINNTCSFNNGYGIYLEESNNNLISKNTANNNGKSGIYLERSDENIVSGNFVNENDIHGIFLEDCDNNFVSGNIISENGNCGIFLENSDKNNITENILINNQECIVELNCKGNNIVNNQCYPNG